MKLALSHILLTILLTVPLFAQDATVSGTIVDSGDRAPLIGATVSIHSVRDSTRHRGDVTDRKGSFSIADVQRGRYRLKVSYVGYEDYDTTITVGESNLRLGSLAIKPKPVMMDPVEVVENMPIVEQKKDTLQFSAKAFKTNPDATAEDLVGKMPGIQVDKGTVKAQGEEVKKTLVDGKQYFGDDAIMALRNLPADLVDKVQVFDKLSEQAELTGFDDGQAQKTMNIITKATRRNGVFGKLYGGYGTEDKYQAGATINWFEDTRRISFLGLSNNVNQQNFSFQDILGVSGVGQIPRQFSGLAQAGMRMIQQYRGGGGGGRGGFGGGGADFFVGQQNGINTTHSIGANMNDTWAEKVEFSGSYFFNMTKNDNETKLHREYFLTGDSTQLYDENNAGGSDNQNHRMNFKVEYAIDTLNTVIVQPRLSVQSNTSNSAVMSGTTRGAFSLNNALTNNNSDVNGYNFSNSLVYRHRFGEPGRTISLNLTTSFNNRDGESYLNSRTTYFNGPFPQIDTADQRSNSLNKGANISANVGLTEMFGRNAQLQVNYTASLSRNSNDKNTFAFDPASANYTTPVSSLTSKLESDYLTHRPGIGYRMRTESWNALVQMNYQFARLTGSSTNPTNVTVDKTFSTLLPMVNIQYKLGDRENMNIQYRTNTNAPSVTQLQEVVDNTNPLQLSTGNPNLRQDYTHTLMIRFNLSNKDWTNNFFTFLYGGFTDNYIGNTTLLAERDTTLTGGIVLRRGSQLTYPVNVNGYQTLRSLFTYSLPFRLISSNLNLNLGFNYSRSPGLINGLGNVAYNYAVAPGVILSSNISEKIDFTLSYLGTKTIAENSYATELNNEYFLHNASARLNWIFWEGIVFRSDVTHQMYRGLSSEFNQDYILWNMTLGKKLFKDDSGELALSVFDVLDQNKSSYRTVTESYIEDQMPLVMRRYFVLTFTYNLRSFPEGDGRGRGPGMGPMGFPPMR